jgi:hypothetical protein
MCITTATHLESGANNKVAPLCGIAKTGLKTVHKYNLVLPIFTQCERSPRVK